MLFLLMHVRDYDSENLGHDIEFRLHFDTCTEYLQFGFADIIIIIISKEG